MKDKLHGILFPRYQTKIRAIVSEARRQKDEAEGWKHQTEQQKQFTGWKEDRIKVLEQQVKELENKPKPTMADLMREILGGAVNFTDVESDGLPKHFLDTATPKEREMFIAQLHEIANLEVWGAMMRYNIDLQGNHIVRLAPDDIQASFARGTINGLSMLRNEVRKGSAEYVDRSKPPDKFDEFSVDLLQKDLDD